MIRVKENDDGASESITMVMEKLDNMDRRITRWDNPFTRYKLGVTTVTDYI